MSKKRLEQTREGSLALCGGAFWCTAQAQAVGPHLRGAMPIAWIGIYENGATTES